MRILVFSNCDVVEHTGSGYVIGGFVSGLRDKGHCVTAYEPRDFEIMQWMRPSANSDRIALGMLRCISRLSLHQFDIVVFWGAASWRAMRWLRRQRCDRPLVVHHTNGPEPRYDPKRWDGQPSLRRRVRFAHARESFLLADAIVTVNHDDERWLRQAGLGRECRMAAIEPGLSPEFCSSEYRPRRTRLIGFCGAWLPRKGIESIAAGLPTVLRVNPDWRLQLVGVGAGFRAERWFPPDVVSRIDVVPFIRDKAELARTFSSWEILIFPSRFESFGMVLAEAMACGCACATTRVGFSKGLADRVDVLHIDHGTSSLVEGLNALMADEGLRQSLGAAAVRRTRRLTWDAAIDRYDALLRAWAAHPVEAAGEAAE